MAQARGRLVEQQQHRIDAQRPRDFDDSLLAQRQAACKLVHLVGEADPLDLVGSLGKQLGLVGTVEPQHRGDRAGMAAQMRADRDILQHGHVGDQLHVLEGPADAELDDLLRRRVVELLAEYRNRA